MFVGALGAKRRTNQSLPEAMSEKTNKLTADRKGVARNRISKPFPMSSSIIRRTAVNMHIAAVSTAASRGKNDVIANIATGMVLKANASGCSASTIVLLILQIEIAMNAKTGAFIYLSQVGTKSREEKMTTEITKTKVAVNA